MHTKGNNTIVFQEPEILRVNGRVYYYEVDVKEGFLYLSVENHFRYEYIELDLERYIQDFGLHLGYQGSQEIYLDDESINISEFEIADLILFCLDDTGNWKYSMGYLANVDSKSISELDLDWYRSRFVEIAHNVLRTKYKFKKQRSAYIALMWTRHYGKIKNNLI